jgi:hypothetical protein
MYDLCVIGDMPLKGEHFEAGSHSYQFQKTCIGGGNKITLFGLSCSHSTGKRLFIKWLTVKNDVFEYSSMTIENISISSPVEEKIRWANECRRKLGEHILEDKTVADILQKIKNAIPASHAEMSKTGMIDLCRQCEQEEGGSCCGYGMENKYDGWLLLINRLMDVELPKARRDPKSCFFLGERGCLLEVRHVICINYICEKISRQIEPHKISALREKEGIEIDYVFLLHEQIKKVLKNE